MFNELERHDLSNIATAAANWDLCHSKLFETIVKRCLSDESIINTDPMNYLCLLIWPFGIFELSNFCYPHFRPFYLKVVETFSRHIDQVTFHRTMMILYAAYHTGMTIDEFPQLKTPYEIIIKHFTNNLNRVPFRDLCCICLFSAAIAVKNVSLFITSMQRILDHLQHFLNRHQILMFL